MKKHLKNRSRGSALVTTALVMFAAFGFAALGVDVGAIVTARNQLQSGIDAAALAGAAGLVESQQKAINEAIQVAANNTVHNNPIVTTAGDISFPSSTQVRVQASQNVNLFFARIIGLNTVNVTAGATADLANVGGTKKFRPFAVPELAYQPGQIVTIKAGSKDDPYTNPSFYYPICFPPENRGTPVTGASKYEQRILEGYEDYAYIGDDLLIEPGMMTGPTSKGINALIAMDPNANWNGSQIVNSDFPGNTSPRVVKVPMFDTSVPPPPGRKTIKMSNMAAFFILPMQGKNVPGVFLGLTSSGILGTSQTHLKMVHLTE